MSASNSESWGLIISTDAVPHSTGNIIEECEVSGFNNALPGANQSAIGFLGTASGIIRNNRVYGIDSNTSTVNAIISQSDTIVEDNYVEGANSATRSEGDETNVVYVHNVFKNCLLGMNFWNGGYVNLTFAFNQIEITNTFPVGQAFYFGPGPATNILLIGNNITCLGPPSSVSSCYFGRFYNVTGLTILDNTMDAGLQNIISGCANVNIDYNYDLYGNYLTGLNIPTVGGVPVTSFGLGLVASAGASSTLASLGLPSTPSVIVTNNSTGVMLSGAFGGNGGGLTNVTASYLAGVGLVGTNSDGTSFTFGGASGVLNSLSFGTNSSADRNSLAFANGFSWDNSLAFAGGQASSDSLAFGINHAADGADGRVCLGQPRFACIWI